MPFITEDEIPDMALLNAETAAAREDHPDFKVWRVWWGQDGHFPGAHELVAVRDDGMRRGADCREDLAVALGDALQERRHAE